MGFRFRRSFKIAPGVRLNMGRTGLTSLSLGGKGLTTNVGRRGVKTTVGLPGTGLSYTTSPPPKAGRSAKAPVVARVQAPITSATVVAAPKHNQHKVLKSLGALLLALVVAAAVHPLVGLLVGLVLLWLILRSGRPKSAPAVASAPVPASAVAPTEPQPTELPQPLENELPQPAPPLAASDIGLERLRLTAATKLTTDPSGGSKGVGQLPAGCDVTVLSRRPGWMFVQADSGVEGWARDQNWTALPRK